MTNRKPIATPYQGTTRAQLALPPLNPEHFQVNERDLSQYLAFTAKIGQAITFYDLKDRPDGTWSQFLLSEPLFLTAVIKETDSSELYSRALDFQRAMTGLTTPMMRNLFYQYYFDTCLEVALRINRWYQYASRLFFPTSFAEYLTEIITSEGAAAWQQVYTDYYTLVEGLSNFKNKMLIKCQQLAPIWQFDPFPRVDPASLAIVSASEEGNEHNEASTPDADMLDWLQEVGYHAQQLFHVQDLIIGAAGQYFTESLKREDIPAQTGLMLSFFRTLDDQRAILNQATEKHLNFYYREVLGLRPKTAEPDKTWLTFVLDKDQTTYTLPQGSLFAAGTLPDSTTVRNFASDEVLTINKTALSSYQTLSLPRATVDGHYPTLTGIYKGEASAVNALPTQEWPAFGQGLLGTNQGPLSTQSTTLGWAFSAPDLLLTSGNRWLKLELSFFTTAQKDAKGNDYSPVSELDQLLAGKSTADISAWLEALFTVEITDAKGWTTLLYADKDSQGNAVQATYTSFDVVSGVNVQCNITFWFELKSTAPATAPYSAEVHGPGYETDFPILRMTLTEQGDTTPGGIEYYPLLSAMALKETNLDASVTDFKNFILQNDDGALDPSKPFSPFGTQPVQGAAMLLGSQELFCKPLSDLTVTLEWDELPISKSFFQQYLAYNLHPLETNNPEEGGSLTEPVQAEPYYLNPTFQAEANALQPTGWSQLQAYDSSITPGEEKTDPTDPKRYFSLYANLISDQPFTFGLGDKTSKLYEAYELEANGPAPEQSPPIPGIPLEPGPVIPATPNPYQISDSLTVQVSLSGLEFSPLLGPVTKFSADSAYGFLQLELANPVQGFGKTDYPRVVSDVTNHNTAVIMESAKKGGSPPETCSLDVLLGKETSKVANMPIGTKVNIALAKKNVNDYDAFKEELLKVTAKTWPEVTLEDLKIPELLGDFLDSLLGDLIKALKDAYEALLLKIIGGLGPVIPNSTSAEEVKSLRKSFDDQLKKLDDEDEQWAENILGKVNLPGGARDLLVRMLDRLLDPLQDAHNRLIQEFRELAKPLLELVDNVLLPELERDPDALRDELEGMKADGEAWATRVLTPNPPSKKDSIIAEFWKQYRPGKYKVLHDRFAEEARKFIDAADPLVKSINSLIEALNKAYSQCLQPNPNTPYIPKAKSISVSYNAHNDWANSVFKTYRIGPNTVWPAEDQDWLPTYTQAGYAYLGFTAFTLGTPLTLMVALRTPVKSLKQNHLPKLTVEYPTVAGWKSLTITRDGTQGLLQSGILLFTLPTDLEVDCIEVAYPTGTPTAWIRMVKPQANLEVTFSYLAPHAVTSTDTTAGLASIAPGTIAKATEPAIKSVTQPLTSIDGRSSQTEPDYWQTSAWRLQNKQRAGRLKDYETLAMEEFPQIFQAKAMNYCGMKLTRNQINLLLIAQKQLSDPDAYAPNMPAHVLLQVLQYLEDLQQPGLTLNLINPRFAHLEVTANIIFDEGYQTQKQVEALQLAMRQYLAPWITDSPLVDAARPAQWSKGALYAFVKKQPHVKAVVGDFVCDLYLPKSTTPTQNLVPSDPQVLVVPGSQVGITLNPDSV